MNRTILLIAGALVALSACTSGPPQLPYPAYVQVDQLEDVFMASLPGIRAKQLAGDPQTRRTSNRVDLPAGWSGTSGASPGRSLEIFVLSGQLSVADIALGRGGYAFLPSGSLGFNLLAPDGARILYFLNDSDPRSIIRSPIIIDTGLLDWEGTAASGVSIKMLRNDPGTGARTWLQQVATGASIPWSRSSALREGFFIDGSVRHSECVDGEVHTGEYPPGGYFLRPANTINGGPQSVAVSESTWLLREAVAGREETMPACVAETPVE